MHSTQIPGNLAEGETVQGFRIPAPKHTPGPWRVDPQYPIDVEALDGRRQVCSPYSEGMRGSVCEPVGEMASPREALANARLIAQAPTMLSDLTDAAAQLRKYETLHRAKGTPDSLEKAEVNAALAARFEATIAAAVGSPSTQCCEPTAEEEALLASGEYRPEELWGGPRPTCPKCFKV